MTNNEADSTGISRRTAIGAAWAAPVVALAIATPMAAASGGIPVLAFDDATITYNEGVPFLNFTLLKTGGDLAAGAFLMVNVYGFELAPYGWTAKWESALGSDPGDSQRFTLLTDMTGNDDDLFILQIVGTPDWTNSQLTMVDRNGTVLAISSINPTEG